MRVVSESAGPRNIHCIAAGFVAASQPGNVAGHPNKKEEIES